MSLLQLARCCNCAKPVLPCSDCSTNKCACEGTEPFETPDGVSQVVGSTIPVTSVHIEVGRAQSRSFRATSTKDNRAWHYMNNLKWRATEYGVRLNRVGPTSTGRIVTRMVLSATAYMLGYRYKDKLGRIGDKIMPYVLPAGQWGARPETGLNPRRAECVALGKPLPCDDLVMCCNCDIPGNPHYGGCTTSDLCSDNGGTNLGPCEDYSPDDCTPVCEAQQSGLSLARMGALIPDPLRKGIEYVAKRFDPSKKNNGIGLHWKYLLRKNAAETATYPVLKPEGDYDLVSKSEQDGFEMTQGRRPISSPPDPLTPPELDVYNSLYRGGRANFADPPQEPEKNCCPDLCSRNNDYWNNYFRFLDQRDKGVWNFVHYSADCCGADYAGTSYTIEMDWPCEETASAYIKAQQKFDFGKAAYEEAKRYCEENPNDTDCGGPGGPVHMAHLCHPLAEELIGAQPSNLIPCIKHCPLQAGGGACEEGFRRWPQGDFQPLGENVEQNIACVGGADVVNSNDGVEVIPTGELGCSFTTNPVGRNYSSIANCDEHQCGAAICGAQFCCREEDCIEYDCCEQLNFNPQTGEFAEYDDDGCIVDKDGQKIGGWRTYPDDDGTYFRCPRQEVIVTGVNDFGDEYTICPGCTKQKSIEQVCADCGPANSQQPSCRGNGSQCNPRGDVTNWTVPRKRRNVGQGTYAKHCPDHLEPFTLNGQNYWGKPWACDRDQNPAVGDPDFCWWNESNPSGTFCAGGMCVYYSTQTGAFGSPMHLWPRQDIRQTGCAGPFTAPAYPCERKWKNCAEPGTGGDDIVIGEDQPPRPPPGQGPNNGSDLCDDLCLEDMFDDHGHCAAACGSTPCGDKVIFRNIVTGETYDNTDFPGGAPPDLTGGDWRQCVCVRCPFDGIGRATSNNSGCGPVCCGKPRGWNANLMAFSDGYSAEEIGLEYFSVSCSPQLHRAFEVDGFSRTDFCSGETRPKYQSESHFTVAVSYKGGGCGYSGFGRARGAVPRTGRGFATLAKDEDAPSTCVFGTYKNMIGRNDGWFTAGGANPAPYWQGRVNPGRSYYYKEILGYDENGRPDCNREIWKRPYNVFGCKFNPPKVVIS